VVSSWWSPRGFRRISTGRPVSLSQRYFPPSTIAASLTMGTGRANPGTLCTRLIADTAERTGREISAAGAPRTLPTPTRFSFTYPIISSVALIHGWGTDDARVSLARSEGRVITQESMRELAAEVWGRGRARLIAELADVR
jgi:hypothetical protein